MNRNYVTNIDYRYTQQQRRLDELATKYGLKTFRPNYHADGRDCNTVLLYTEDDYTHNRVLDGYKGVLVTYTAEEARRASYHIHDQFVYRDYVCSFENTDCNGRFDLGFANHGSVDLRHFKWPESLEEWLCERIANSNNPSILTAMRDKALEHLWDKLTDVPLNEDEELEKRYLHFPIGTEKEEIWYWFDQKHSKGVYYLLYEREV